MSQHPPRDVNDRWIQQMRRTSKTAPSWACTLCPEQRIFRSNLALWEHAQSDHLEQLPLEDKNALQKFRDGFEAECLRKSSRPARDDSIRKPILNETNRAQPEPPPSKYPLNTPTRLAPTRSTPGLGALNLGTPGDNEDVDMKDLSYQAPEDQPRKRAAIGDGITAGSASPSRDSPLSPSPRRSKARLTSAPYGTPPEESTQRPAPARKSLWTEQRSPLTRSSVDPSNIASVQAQKSRRVLYQQRTQQPLQPPQNTRTASTTTIETPASQNLFSFVNDSYDIILQPETRPISQEQLVAEVKGIYAGLVMVEAKCIEVDNKQATLAQGDPQAQPKLNNEQWQALIALHRTLLHEHHDFFLVSQHPSASPALRRLASKYAMPARMWRHGIHSFLELLRHRLPASLDHMLAFIYLAYSMMALLYETVPAFEDTWIECLGDLGRYRMAIEDDDLRDREVWTEVARYWYSKATDKAPTTGRLYHHLAILARPNALQQLFYYSKSLCVAAPFVSARESILTLFNPVLDTGSTRSQLRLPPLDMSFVKAHGLLFTNKNIEKFEDTKNEFLGLLDNQIGRVTRKFMEQGYHIAVANSIALTGFAAKDNPLMQIISPSKDVDGIAMASSVFEQSMASFKLALGLNNPALRIVLQRIGDPNVLPFVHVILVFMFNMTRHTSAMDLLQEDYPWDLLAIMLNTLLAQYKTPTRIEAEQFPLPAIDDFTPFPEDFAMRGLLWADNYFPEQRFASERIDEATYHMNTSTVEAEDKQMLRPPVHEYSKASDEELLSLRTLWRRATHWLEHHKKSIARMFFLSRMQGVVASSVGSSSMNEESSIWSTIVLATTLGSVLTGIMSFPGCRDTELLLFPTIVVDIGCYIMGTDDRISNADLAVTWLFGAGLNILLLRDRLRTYSRTGGLMALLIAILGTSTAIGFACLLSFAEGERYANPLVFVAMGMLPGTLFWELVWLVLAQLMSAGPVVQAPEELAARLSIPQGEEARAVARVEPFQRAQYTAQRGDYRRSTFH
ncbi:hypothetical protein BDZ45DRAFT_734852 [Acephala macrosclerotiorum]|nr:hypothetical protein BDZ45DRAFT_734852 [Acephala macrosclerotiorum]